ncbi:uncharacterized protein LOC119673293 [Teleopsis dalmanni]|uniref:uncharacterized protein LOC119671809 n=1 Tax=Teleopsis dalmanni TaxID=139649 RepID=UPI0018CD76D1|nr:uncharacterized protein LOC119671809 [Teleopsis dalmanni]XP_037940490.1 uncharacterized protein LOC119673293 [Teleopsis dalmanni]
MDTMDASEDTTVENHALILMALLFTTVILNMLVLFLLKIVGYVIEAHHVCVEAVVALTPRTYSNRGTDTAADGILPSERTEEAVDVNGSKDDLLAMDIWYPD